jgi:hypothetical protein
MNEPRRIIVGLLPTAGATYVGEGQEDPVAVMIREAGAELDRQRAAEERLRLAAIADAARLANTRRARTMRRLNRALKAFARLR